MPRLSSNSYLTTRLALRDADAWLHALDLDDFIAVQRFFAPTKQFTDQEALAHRRAVTAKEPSLPHRVGKILRKQPVKASFLERQVSREIGVSVAMPVDVGSHGREQALIVRGVHHREVDLHKLARIIEMDLRKPVGERLIDRIQKHDHDEAA